LTWPLAVKRVRIKFRIAYHHTLNGDAGIVHEDVEFAKVRDSSINEGLGGRWFTLIAPNGWCFSAICLYPADNFVAFLGGYDVTDCYVSAFFGKSFGSRRPKPA
jgi:hypothetical protein